MAFQKLADDWTNVLREIAYCENSFVGSFLAKLERATKIRRDYFVHAAISIFVAYLILGRSAQFLCNLVGYVYPAYASFKALQTTDNADDMQWLTYWTVFGFFSLLEFASDQIVGWFPLYWLGKFLFSLWLIAPSTRGAQVLYARLIVPFMDKYSARLAEIEQEIRDKMKPPEPTRVPSLYPDDSVAIPNGSHTTAPTGKDVEGPLVDSEPPKTKPTIPPRQQSQGTDPIKQEPVTPPPSQQDPAKPEPPPVIPVIPSSPPVVNPQPPQITPPITPDPKQPSWINPNPSPPSTPAVTIPPETPATRPIQPPGYDPASIPRPVVPEPSTPPTIDPPPEFPHPTQPPPPYKPAPILPTIPAPNHDLDLDPTPHLPPIQEDPGFPLIPVQPPVPIPTVPPPSPTSSPIFPPLHIDTLRPDLAPNLHEFK